MSFFKRFTSKEKKSPVTKEKEEVEEYFLKIALLGEGAVGKTSLRRRYMGQGFTTQHLMTIGADFATLTKEINGKKVTWQIWDLAGQENFREVRNHYFKGCMGGIVVFDLTRKESFDAIDGWIKELFKHNGRGKIPFIILGNKYDLENKAVSPEEIKEKVAKYNKEVKGKGFEVVYLNTSAKEGLNVEEAFDTLGKMVFEWLKTLKK